MTYLPSLKGRYSPNGPIIEKAARHYIELERAGKAPYGTKTSVSVQYAVRLQSLNNAIDRLKKADAKAKRAERRKATKNP